MMRDLHHATSGSAPDQKNPTVGLYNVKPAPPVYQETFNFSELYPEFIQIAQPSLYVQGDARRVRDAIRGNYDVLKKRVIVPWLTAGTYGRFDSFKVEQMVLEAYLNGAGGITYYAFRDFDALEFYYHARAIALLASQVELLLEGSRIPAEISAALSCSAFGTERKALVLVANYGNSQEQRGALVISDKKITSARELHLQGEDSPVDVSSLSIPPHGHRLLLLEFEK